MSIHQSLNSNKNLKDTKFGQSSYQKVSVYLYCVQVVLVVNRSFRA